MLTAEQLKSHYNGIGGSMASSILGVNKYQSNVDAYLLLTDPEYRAAQQRELNNKLQIQIGNALEALVIEHAQRDKGWKIITPQETFIDPEHPFLLGHVDGLIDGTNELVEIKTRGNFAAKEYGDEDSDQIQDSEYIQIMHYLMLTGRERGHLAALMLGTSEIKYFIVERNEEVIAHMRELLVEFWHKHILERNPPKPLTYSEASKLWPKSGELERVATDEIINCALEIKQLNSIIKEKIALVDSKKTQLATFMQDADTLVDGEYNKILTYKTQYTNRVDLDLLRYKYPDIANECTTLTMSRVMRFNPKYGAN